MERCLYMLTGPTASGKTELALEWAEHNDAEILSCDALLFYRGMDIGTAKPDPQALARVPHHGVNLRSVRDSWDVAAYARYAQEVVSALWHRGKRVLVTGGSGLYLLSFLRRVADEVEVPPALRCEVERFLEREGLPAAVERLRGLNPSGLGDLDVHNPRRVLRALERCLASGRTLDALRADYARLPLPFAGSRIALTVLSRDDAVLRHRIASRTHAMLEAGLVEEVTRLIPEGLLENRTARAAIGYAQTLAWLESGGGSRELLAEAIVAATWKLVRKQRTWFRHQLPASRLLSLDADKRPGVEELFDPPS